MTGLVWETPRASSAGRPSRKDWPAIAAELMARPGEWALIDTDCSRSTPSGYATGMNKAFRPVGAWEFLGQGGSRTPARVAKLFGRYVGEISE